MAIEIRNVPMAKVEQKDGWGEVTIWNSSDPDENDVHKSKIPDGTIVWICKVAFWKDKKPYILVEVVSNHRKGWAAARNVKPIDPPNQGVMFYEELRMLCD